MVSEANIVLNSAVFIAVQSGQRYYCGITIGDDAVISAYRSVWALNPLGSFLLDCLGYLEFSLECFYMVKIIFSVADHVWFTGFQWTGAGP